MEWPIEMDLGKGMFADIFLSIRISLGEIVMDYYDSQKEQFILDQLSSFQRVKFDDKNPLHITFIGDKVKRSFRFKDEDAMSNVWSYLQNYVRFQSISGEDRSYMIIHLRKYSSDRFDFSHKESSQKKDISSSKSYITTPEAISSNLIVESLPDFDFINVDENNYQNIFNNNGTIKDEYKISNIEIKFDFIFNLWKKILNIYPLDNDFADYQKLFSQWNPVYLSQWKNNCHLRNFVALLEADLKNSYLPTDFQKLAFEILMSFYYQRFGRISYSSSFYKIITFLIDSSIIIENRDNNENRFHLHDGDISDRITISVTLFYMFSVIYDRFFDSSSPKFEFVSLDVFTDNINKILHEYSPSTLKLLKSYNIKNFDFIYQYIQSFLIDEKQHNQDKYLFTSFITAKLKGNFAVNLIAASLIMLHYRLAHSLYDHPDSFHELYIVLLMNIDDKLLIENTINLEKMSDEKFMKTDESD